MQRLLFKSIAVALGAFTISACGSAPEDLGSEPDLLASMGEPAEAEVAETEVVAEMDVAGVRVTFLRVTEPNGAQRVVLQEMGPMNVMVSPTRDLAMARGRTALEVFLALSPDDAQVPAALEETHEAQARGLGREDVTSVIDIDFELPTVVEKSSATCDDWVFATMGGDYSITNKKRIEEATGIDDLITDWTTSSTTVGACNESATETGDVLAYYIFQPSQADLRREIDQNGLQARGVRWIRYGALSPMPPGSRGRWFNYSFHPAEMCNGLICTVAPTKYAVQATLLPGHLFRLRTAHVARNPE